MDDTRRPLDVLEAAVGERIAVELKDGTQYNGRLAGYDQHMNLVVETNEDRDTTVIRGDNVVSIRL